MKQVEVPLQFTGVVSVLVPGHLSSDDAKLLAEKAALCRILASCDNSDAPDEEACMDYIEECSDTAQATAEQDWDASRIIGVGGQWTVMAE
jgi:hypothetical protein